MLSVMHDLVRAKFPCLKHFEGELIWWGGHKGAWRLCAEPGASSARFGPWSIG